MRKSKLKQLAKYLFAYSILIGIIIGIRLLHGMEINWHYYITITIVIFSFVVLLSFLKPEHLERILPKNSKLALIMQLILRFLPVVKMHINNIKNSQEMRGVNYRGINQLKNSYSLLIPSMLIAMRWSDNITEGISMRGGME